MVPPALFTTASICTCTKPFVLPAPLLGPTKIVPLLFNLPVALGLETQIYVQYDAVGQGTKLMVPLFVKFALAPKTKYVQVL